MSTATASEFASLVETDSRLYELQTNSAGPAGSLPLTEELLRNAPSGELFGLSQDVGMGWNPTEVGRREFLLLSTSGGIRNPDGTPVALGYHTGHWEVGLLMKAAAEELKTLGCVPFAGFCTDPCDGRSQGTTGMMDSLPYRNDAALVLARRSARALDVLERRKIGVRDILTDAAVRNAMVVHAAFGGSTNLLLHVPAIAYHAGLRRPTVEDWGAVNRKVPRLVDALPNGPVGHPTIRVFLAGGVPEGMLHLRRLGLLDVTCLTVSGATLDHVLDWWEHSERRARLRAVLREREGIDPGQVMLSPGR